MNVIRTYGIYQLVHEPLQNMYRVTDGTNLSYWFNSDTKDELMDLDNDQFENECEELIEIAK